MLRQLHLQNFRALREFSMHGLGRVNLLVGTNNCGKTSVLEAIHILSSPASPFPMWQILARRGEVREGADEVEVEVAHIVHGHVIKEGHAFTVSGKNDMETRSVVASFRVRSPNDTGSPSRSPQRQLVFSDLELDDDDGPPIPPLALELAWKVGGKDQQIRWALSRRGGLHRSYLPRLPDDRARAEVAPVHFVTTEGLTRESVVSLFDEVALTPDEDVVLEALRTIEPEIKRIATVGGARGSFARTRGGVIMSVADARIPVGSMGDGIWRLLGIALALVNARGGILLVDEIDTGLHHSVISNMWQLVHQTAARLDVQVFATTHSRDCYEALSAIDAADGEVSLQRIERGNVEAVPFHLAEIQAAAKRGIEVR